MILSFNESVSFQDLKYDHLIDHEMNFSTNIFHENEDLCLNDIFNNEDKLFELLKTEQIIDKIKSINQIDIATISESQKKTVNYLGDPPDYFSLDKIKELLNSKLPNELSKELAQNIFTEDNIEKVESNINDQKLLGKKKKKKNKDISKEEENKDEKKNKKDENSKRKHGKFCGDNIIKKIKFRLFESFREFVNKVINENLDKTQLAKYNRVLRPSNKKDDIFENLIKMNDYQDTVRINKKLDLEILNMTFKELFSKDISSMYSKLESNSNKVIIHKLLEEEYENKNIYFALNMKFIDWFDVFRYKKDLDSIINCENEIVNNIKKYFKYVDELIIDINKINEEDNCYLLYFLIHLYNYERWFCLKRGRNRISKKEKDKIE